MRTVKLTIQYDGTAYVGWQRQAEGASIQALVEDALAPIEGTPVTVPGAGRTDAGVHALAQTASATLTSALPADAIARALNAVLPGDVRIASVEDVALDFHGRFSSTGKTYEYRIVNAPFISPFLVRYAWHIPQPLDLDAMRSASAHLVGRHDFAAYQGTGSIVHSTERTVDSIEWSSGAGHDVPLAIRITGEGFLRHMVRNIVGALVEVGTGRWNADRPVEALRSRSRAHGARTAPAHGLFLVSVRYGPR